MKQTKNLIIKKINDLIPYARNARTHSDEQVLKIASSIKEFGFLNPILIDKENGIIAGHGRALAAKKLNLAEVPCVLVENLSETQKKAYILADNKLALDAGWDEEILKIELEELQNSDLENGCNFDFEIEADLSGDWQIGVVVGCSGSGKTSIGKVIFGENLICDYTKNWSEDKPIIEDIAPNADFNAVTGALASVGLGDVPAWLRPFKVLSNGEQFRAGLARLICEKPKKVVIDEFTSVVDRQIAKIGSGAFQKAWRRENPNGKVVLLTPHYDILDWIEPDWIIDTKTKTFERGRLRQRPKIKLEIFKTNSSYWHFFKPHYYLNLPMPIAAEYFVGTVNGEFTCHLAVTPRFEIGGYRATRMVTMPEWQGTGIGMKFLDWICEHHLQGNGRKKKQFPTYFHTSHPQLCAALRRSKKWVQKSAILYGDNKTRSAKTIMKTSKNKRKIRTGYGGHFRAVQGFKYIGEKRL